MVKLTVAGQDPELDERLSTELTAYNEAVTGVRDQREVTVKVVDGTDTLIAGLSGWTWGTSAGIELVWVHEDHRAAGWGARLLEAAEREARSRGCRQVLVSSFTFQAPEFYRRHGYVERGRSEGIPHAGTADVHFVKRLEPVDGGR